MHLADWIPVLRLTRLISSPFQRALETTEPIHRTTGLMPEVWIDLHERGGCVSGTTPAEMKGRPGLTHLQIKERFPGFQVSDEIDGDGWWQSKPYETDELASLRAERLLRQTQHQFAHTDERVAYVMHGDFKIMFLECACSGTSQLEVPSNTAVSKIVFTNNDVRLDFYNSTKHLPDELISF